MASIYEQTLLFDYYKNLLSPRQSEVCRLHLYEDWSLAEIAEELNISRQAAHDALQKGLNELTEAEEKLGLVAKFKELDEALEKNKASIPSALYNELKTILFGGKIND